MTSLIPTWSEKMKMLQSKFYLDQLAELIGVKTPDDIAEDYFPSKYIIACGEDIERTMELEAQEYDELFKKYSYAMVNVAEDLFNKHGLNLERIVPKEGDFSWEYKIVPMVSWLEAANKIKETINGVGYFHFNNTKEFLDSGPYTARQAVLSHLGYIKDYCEVYGEAKPQYRIDRSCRY